MVSKKDFQKGELLLIISNMPILLLFSLLLRLILWPFIQIAAIFGPLKSRRAFERRNLNDPQCLSFLQTHERADILFHFSSEGEFEQIRPLIESMLDLGHKVELMFTSESVETKLISFARSYKDRVRFLRVPLVEFFPFIFGQNLLHWSTAKKMVMVRYDFFPDLMTLGMRMSRFILYSASMKSKTNSGFSWGLKKLIYESYTDIFCATKNDFLFFSKALERVNVHPELDLRSLQISHRQMNFHKQALSSSLRELYEMVELEKRICLAQLWPNEVDLFSDSEFLSSIIGGECFVYLAPHKLAPEFVAKIVDGIRAKASGFGLELPIYTLEKDAGEAEIQEVIRTYKEKAGLIISSIPGVLCESYPFFSHVFIGGGHGKGVHSLLEPFMGQALITCGPGVHRSTEYEIVKEYSGDNRKQIQILDNLKDFYHNCSLDKSCATPSEVLENFVSHNEIEMNKLIKILDNHNA